MLYMFFVCLFFLLPFLKSDAEAHGRQKGTGCLLSVAILRKSSAVCVFSGMDLFSDRSQQGAQRSDDWILCPFLVGI